VVVLARGFHKSGVHDAAFAGDEAFAFKVLAEGFEELATAFAPALFDALLEVPERFGVVTQAVELLQHEDFEHEHGVEGRLATFAPVARGVAGEVFKQRAEALPGDEVAQLEDAGAFGGHGPLVLNGAEESSSSLGLAVAFHARSLRIF
jgi:hypothetical protein